MSWITAGDRQEVWNALADELQTKDMRIEVFSDEMYEQRTFQNQHCLIHSQFGKLLKSKRNKILKAGRAFNDELLDAGEVDRYERFDKVREFKAALYKEAHEKIVKRNLKKIAGLKPGMTSQEINRVLDNDTKGAYYCADLDILYTVEHDGKSAHDDPEYDTWDVFANGEWVGEIQRNYCMSASYTPHHGNTYHRSGSNLYWYFMFQNHKDSETGEPIVYPNVDTFTYNYHNGEGGVCSVRHKGIIREGEYPTEGPTKTSKAIFSPDRFKTIGTAFKYYIEMDIVHVKYQRSLVEGGEE